MRIALHDYVGHPFQVQLSRELARRGHRVLHLYSASIQTPRGRLARQADDSPMFSVEAIRLRSPIAKQAFARRWFQEVEYGRRLVRSVSAFGPDVVMSANAPLEAQRQLAAICKRRKFRFVYWVQDLYGVATHRILRRRLPIVGSIVGSYYVKLERRLIANSDHVVFISKDFAGALGHRLPATDRVSVIPNWTPLEEVPERPKANAWSRAMDLAGRDVILYAGTLGMKHNPGLLLELAQHMSAIDRARLVVVSEGPAVEWLQREAKRAGLTNIVLLGFQPFEQMPDVLAAADVLVAILEPDAGLFSVPSKVLTYLAAGRAILAAIPVGNQAAQVLLKHGAGMVVDPREVGEFADAGVKLLRNRELRAEMGRRGRAFAEQEYDISTIGDRFEAILCS